MGETIPVPSLVKTRVLLTILLKVIYMSFKLTVIPALELDTKGITFTFNTREELEAASNSCALLILHLQDSLNVMKDYSGFHIKEYLEDGEWIELEELEDVN
jgi:hypothetical protein